MAGILDLLSGNSSQPSVPRAGGASDFLRRLAPAIAMIDPRNAQLGMGLMAMNADRDEQAAKQQNRNQTASWLQQQGMGAEEASYLASDPAALRAWYGEWKSGGKPEWRFETIYDDQGREQKAMVDIKTGKFNVIGGTKSNLLSPEEVAQKKEIAAAGRSEINLGEKLPTGYMWKDPENPRQGVTPLPGGPATQLPSEAAGRLGLADSFLQNFDKIKEKVASGQVTGPVDRYRSANDSKYEGAETYRQIQTGVDSLQRMLTGAGMPASEAEQYAFRYLPTYTDDAESMVTKLTRLKDELESVQKKVMQGRSAEPQPQSGPTDYKTKYGLD